MLSVSLRHHINLVSHESTVITSGGEKGNLLGSVSYGFNFKISIKGQAQPITNMCSNMGLINI